MILKPLAPRLLGYETATPFWSYKSTDLWLADTLIKSWDKVTLRQKSIHHLHSSCLPWKSNLNLDLKETIWQTQNTLFFRNVYPMKRGENVLEKNRTMETWQRHINHEPWLNLFVHFYFALCSLSLSKTGSSNRGWLQPYQRNQG